MGMTTQDAKRRIVEVVLTEHMLSVMFREGAMVRCMSGVPEDAVMLGVSADFARRAFVAHFEHPSFDEVDMAAFPPTRMIALEIVESAENYYGATLRSGSQCHACGYNLNTGMRKP
jgi:hypothetical protein